MLVYKITNINNNMTYIGQTCRSIEERLKEHCKPSLQSRSYISAAINKHGIDLFKIEILSKCESQKELDVEEDRLIKEHNSIYPNGYNLRNGGMGGSLSEEAKLKLRNANLGLKHSPERITKAKVNRANSLIENGYHLKTMRPVIGIHLITGEVIELPHAHADNRFHYNCIHRCAKGERKQHKGYKWSYK